MLNLLFIMAVALLPTVQPTGDTNLRKEKLSVERLPDLHTARAGHCVFYAGGELTVVGGHTAGFVLTPTAEYYSAGTWHQIPTVYPHDNGMSLVLSDGQRVLLAGGHEKNLGIGQRYEAETYVSETHTFEGFGCMDRKRAFSQGAELGNGQVVIAGNHQCNDALETFDGRKTFRFAKEAVVWHSSPYVLPVGEAEAIVFGAVWREGKFQPCDTVLRLQGEPFVVALLKDWMPLVYDNNNHAEESCIGDKATGDFSYLVAAQNGEGEMAFLYIHDTVFELVPTTCPIPTESKWGHIKYDRCAVADCTTERAYLVGNDSTGRVYVVAVEYGRRPAPILLYYSDPLPDFGDATPVLTPSGNLVVAGGIIDDNFTPLPSVWLLRMSDKPETLASPPLPLLKARGVKILWWLLGVLLLVGAAVAYMRILFVRRRRKAKPAAQENVGNEAPLASRRGEGAEAELMTRIIGLMETEQMYLNPELKVSDISETLGVHRNAVSACINSHQGCSFSQFVNDYRLQHAKRLLLEASELKVSAVAMESGFANERTFFRVFKTATGMTPKEWQAGQGKG